MAMFGRALKGLASPAGQEALYLLGASLKDIGSGGGDNFLLAQQNLGARRKEADELAAFDGLASTLFGGQSPTLAGGSGSDTLTGAGTGSAGNPGEVAGMTPEMWAQVQALRKTRNLAALSALYRDQQEQQRPVYEAREGSWWKMVPGRMPEEVGKLPQRQDQPTLKSGFRWRTDDPTRQEYIPGSDADPAYIGSIGNVKRDILIDKPLPVRVSGRGTSGGGGTPKRSAQQMSDAELLAIAKGGK